MRPVEVILGRREHHLPVLPPPRQSLITGAKGTLGQALLERYSPDRDSDDVRVTDMDDCDVTDRLAVEDEVRSYRPNVVFHFAAAKHAPAGELDPLGYAETNIVGTGNVIEAAKQVGAHVVLASTCKAADPETVYGATKLVAERMVLEAGGAVARLYNVWPASGNVFEIWGDLPEDEPIPVMPCSRRFITLDEAVDLCLFCAGKKGPHARKGRYAVYPTFQRTMEEIARGLYPDRHIERTFPRRGDRQIEPEMAARELFEFIGKEHVVRIVSSHDPA
jgi:nucleoside-diphosphate-sugar epimerase